MSRTQLLLVIALASAAGTSTAAFLDHGPVLPVQDRFSTDVPDDDSQVDAIYGSNFD